MPNIRIKRISLSAVIDFMSIVVLVVFSTHDCIVKLLPIIPYTALGQVMLGLLILLIFVQQRRLNKYALLFLILTYFIVILNVLICGGVQSEYIKSLFLSISSASRLWVYFIVFSIIKDEKRWGSILNVVAYLNMVLLVITVMCNLYSSESRSINYIGLGITGVMWVPVIIQSTFFESGKKKTLHIIAASFFTIFIFVYGNRGSAIVIMTFLIYCFLFYTKLAGKTIISVGMAGVTVLAYYFQESLNMFLLTIVNRFGIISRNITLLMNNQLNYTTHRTDDIWPLILKSIPEKWLLGYGLCYDRILGGDISVYAHNLVLEAWISFGVILGTLLLLIHLSVGVKNCSRKSSIGWRKLFAPFYISSTVLLMFNNSLCQLAIFWIPYGVYFAYLKNTHKKLNFEV